MAKLKVTQSPVQTFYIRQAEARKKTSTTARIPRIKNDYSVVYVIDYANKNVNVGLAKCRRDETFVRRSGRSVALDRLITAPQIIPLKQFASDRYRDVAALITNVIVENQA